MEFNVTAQVLDYAESAKITPEIRAIYKRMRHFTTLGLFQVLKVEDQTTSFNELCGDMFDPQVNNNIPPETLEREKRNYRAKVNQQGIWGFMFQVRALPTDAWETVESIWGFVGDECIGSGYDVDMMQEAYNWLAECGRLDDLNNALESAKFPVPFKKAATKEVN